MNGIPREKWNPIHWKKYINIQKTCYETLNALIDEYKYNIELIMLEDTGLTDNAALRFLDHSIDFIHIDGDHSYEAVTSDCNSYFKKMKKNGVMYFDDWQWDSTKKAIIDFANVNKLKLNVVNNNKVYIIC